ncbi:hypothetical protein PAMP_006555 [Pampus punctatissimus]
MSLNTRNTIQTQLRPGPQAATSSSSRPSTPTGAALTPANPANPDDTAFKLELLASLRKDIADIVKKELQDSSSTVLYVGEMEHLLSECSDDIAELKTIIKSLTANVARLENKCEDLESRSWRNNVRIVGVPEGPDTCTPAAVTALLKEAFNLVKEPLVDPSLQPMPKPGERPRTIICILRRAKEL